LALTILVLVVAGAAYRFWPHQPQRTGLKADALVVTKSERTLTLLKDGRAIASYRVALGWHPTGPKEIEHDHRTPEGRYMINGHNDRGESRFHRALQISYPNAEDRARAHKLGHPAGKDIMVHGIKNGYGWLGRLHRLIDWTDGCIAVTDEEMDEIWQMTPIGVPIEIRP
jgi:murein L,D-transpeptidase YafK